MEENELTIEKFAKLYWGREDNEILDFTDWKYLNGLTICDIIKGFGRVNHVKFPKGMPFGERPEEAYFQHFYHCAFDFCANHWVKPNRCVFKNCTFEDLYIKNDFIHNALFDRCQIKDMVLSQITLYNFELTNCVVNSYSLNYVCLSFNCQLTGTVFEKGYKDNVINMGNVCPSDGAFVGWKKGIDIVTHDTLLIKLEIPEDAKRSSACGRKCRADKAKVLGFCDLVGNRLSDDTVAISKYQPNFEYRVGNVVEPTEPFDEDGFNECASGIHFFIRKEEALSYIG